MNRNRTNGPRVEKKSPGGVRTFIEFFKTEYGTACSVYADFKKATAIAAEKCLCVNPLNCSCKAYSPPSPRWQNSTTARLFKHSKPYLLYSLYRKDDPKTRVNFLCKDETEVYEEVLRLNSKEKNDTIWTYIVENDWNIAALTEYRDFQIATGDFDESF